MARRASALVCPAKPRYAIAVLANLEEPEVNILLMHLFEMHLFKKERAEGMGCLMN